MPRAFPLLLIAAAITALLIWLLPSGDSESPRPAGNESRLESDPTSDERTAGTPEAEETRERSEAEPIESGSTPSSGTLRVEALWPEEVPASNIWVSLRAVSREQAYQILTQAQTDDEGRVTFEGVPPGRWSLRSDRGDRQQLDVISGEQDVVFQLEGGVLLEGRVVDGEGRAIPDADVWLQTRDPMWSGGRTMAKSAADGSFTLHRIPPHVSIGAFAPGYRRSKLLDLDEVATETEPVNVTLTLRNVGGILEGLVTDLENRPIEGARVGLGEEDGRLDMRGERVIERWSIPAAITDAAGRFRLIGLPFGKDELTVLADGYGYARRECEVLEDAANHVHVRMANSGTIRGLVSHEDGEPFAGALIRCYDLEPRTPFLGGGQIDFDKAFGYRATKADDEGRFVLADVTAGTAFLFAQPGERPRHGQPVIHARDEIDVPPGGITEWNPTLGEGMTISGVVRYQDGHPMKSVFITLSQEDGGGEVVQTNDDKGVFKFVNLKDVSYAIRVQYWDAPEGTQPLRRAGLRPGPGEVLLTAPFDKPVKLERGTVSGRIDDVGLRISNPNATHVTLTSDKRWFRDGGKIENGAFKFDRVEPCKFRLVLMENDKVLAESDWFELLPGQQLDTGVLQTEPGGHVVISAPRDADTGPLEPKLYLRRAEGARSTTISLGHNERLEVRDLSPGTYSVSGYFRGMVSLSSTVTIRAGETAELNLELKRGALVKFEMWIPQEMQPNSYSYSILRDDGTSVYDADGTWGLRETRPYTTSRWLAPGDYAVTYQVDSLTANASFTVPNFDDMTVPLKLR